MLKKKETIVYCFLLIVGAAVYVASVTKVQGLRDRLDPTQIISALHVKPEALEILSGEFRSLLADYLLLKASVYLGGREDTPDTNKKAVSTLFRQSATLDPYFFQTCYLVQGYLPWWKGSFVNEGIEILELFREHRDWDWEPGFYIGFDYFYFLRDNLTASKYLMEAAERDKIAESLGLLGARLSQKGGQTKASIAFLKTMHASTDNENAKKEMERRIAALEGVLVLEKAISRYSLIFQHPPGNLDQLVEAGILKKLPTNPCMPDGSYFFENGKIEF